MYRLKKKIAFGKWSLSDFHQGVLTIALNPANEKYLYNWICGAREGITFGAAHLIFSVTAAIKKKIIHLV